MEDDTLRSEFASVTEELAAARIEYASLGARIAGLEARRAALMDAIPDMVEAAASGDSDIGGRHRTEDIVEVLRGHGSPMNIKEVVAGLSRLGRPGENYENVSADLAYLAERGRIVRDGRGVYSAHLVVISDDDNRRVIELTEGNLRNGHVYLARCADFFPSDAFGGSSREAGLGSMLVLTFEGFPGKKVETDIASDKKIFRVRSDWREFFERHALRANDKVVLQRLSEREYHVTKA